MTDADKLAAVERLAWWMGYTTRRGGNCVYVSRGSVEWVFRPFDKLEDARLLLEECKRRGLMQKVACWLYKLNPDAMSSEGSLMLRAIAVGLLATAEEQTLAVLKVTKLEQGKDGA